jgi:hypothetical protein
LGSLAGQSELAQQLSLFNLARSLVDPAGLCFALCKVCSL